MDERGHGYNDNPADNDSPVLPSPGEVQEAPRALQMTNVPASQVDPKVQSAHRDSREPDPVGLR